MVRWTVTPGNKISARDLYELLALRTDVFVVEQNCPYPELDHRDLGDDIFHVQGFVDGDPKVAASIRLMYDKEAPSDAVQIGRVVVRKEHRALGLGRQAMTAALDTIILNQQSQFRRRRAMLHGQSHLRRFYESFGFEAEGVEFLEDGIPHLEMIKDLELDDNDIYS